jgi:hypothetical protein
MRRASYLLWIAAFLLSAVSVPHAQSLKHCFTDTQFDGWWRPMSDKTIYIRTNTGRYYRLDLMEACGGKLFAGAHLILNVHGSDTICSPLDFDLRINPGVGDIAQPCLVKTMREASPQEVTALEHPKH